MEFNDISRIRMDQSSNLIERIDAMKHKIHKNISLKIQSKLKEESEENYLRNAIFQYLSSEELLNSCLVNKMWNQEVGKLKTFSDRILFKGTKESLDTCLESERSFERINLCIGNSAEEMDKVEQIVLKYSQNLKSLMLVKLGGHNSMLNDSIAFSHQLTEVVIHVVCGRLSGEFLRYVTSLQKLTANGIDPKGLVQILAKNPHLTELTAYENSFENSFLEHDISPFVEFQLKKFALLDHAKSGYALQGEFEAIKRSKRMVGNIRRFLRTQVRLKILQFDTCHAVNVGKFIFPSIRVLEVNEIDGNEDELDPPKDNNIIALLTNFATPSLALKFPSLKVLFVQQFSSDLLFLDGLIDRIYYESPEKGCEWLETKTIIEQMTRSAFKKLFRI